MRKGMDGLVMLAQQVMNEHPFSGLNTMSIRSRGKNWPSTS